MGLQANTATDDLLWQLRVLGWTPIETPAVVLNAFIDTITYNRKLGRRTHIFRNT